MADSPPPAPVPSAARGLSLVFFLLALGLLVAALLRDEPYQVPLLATILLGLLALRNLRRR